MTYTPDKTLPATHGKHGQASSMDWLARAIATVGFVGYSPVAPGTCGTAMAVPLAYALRDVAPVWFLAVAAAVTAIGIAAAHRADQSWSSHDSGRIVIDEVAGYLVTVALVDRSSALSLAVGFAVFRFFDIVKPPPVRWIDRTVPGGAGVVLDDVAAGVLGCLVMLALRTLGALP
jgi:phosphatidylglycerophosphatase A